MLRVATWLLVLTVVVVAIFVAACIAAWTMFGRPAQYARSAMLVGQHHTEWLPIADSSTTPTSQLNMTIPLQLTICGIAYNVEPYLPRLFEILSSLENKLHIRPTYVFYENDSSDRTLQLLQTFMKTRRGKVMTEKGVFKRFPKRTIRLAYARNKVHASVSALTSTDIVMCVDMDNVNMGLDAGSVVRALNGRDEWDVATANQKGHYYDLWALRTVDQNRNCWHKMKCSRLRLLNFFPSTQWEGSIPTDLPYNVPVLSAFGGMGLYQFKYWKAGVYRGSGSEGEQDCEHVAFHKSIRQVYPDVRVCIVPYLVNH
jgi:hypothetical protein